MRDELGGRPDMFSEEDPVLRELEDAAKETGERGFAQRLDGIERLLGMLCGAVARSRDVERVETDRRSEFMELRGKLTELSCDVLRLSGEQVDRASRHDVEEIARTQRNEFSWLRESHAWLRGAATAGAPERPRRSGMVALCVLWAMGGVAAFAAGAVALGLVGVTVNWKGSGIEERASVMRSAPVMPDGKPPVVVPAGPPPLLAEDIRRADEVVPPGGVAGKGGSSGPGVSGR